VKLEEGTTEVQVVTIREKEQSLEADGRVSRYLDKVDAHTRHGY
jgi:hypothetical protein